MTSPIRPQNGGRALSAAIKQALSEPGADAPTLDVEEAHHIVTAAEVGGVTAKDVQRIEELISKGKDPRLPFLLGCTVEACPDPEDLRPGPGEHWLPREAQEILSDFVERHRDA
jgi:hypothetical protein